MSAQSNGRLFLVRDDHKLNELFLSLDMKRKLFRDVHGHWDIWHFVFTFLPHHQGFLQQSHFPIFPFLGMKKVNQFPIVGFFFWINSQKWEQKFQPIPNVGKLNSINSQSQMGTKFSTNSQWGEIKFNQFPVLLECQRKRLIQIFQSIPSSGNSCGNQFPLWE